MITTYLFKLTDVVWNFWWVLDINKGEIQLIPPSHTCALITPHKACRSRENLKKHLSTLGPLQNCRKIVSWTGHFGRGPSDKRHTCACPPLQLMVPARSPVPHTAQSPTLNNPYLMSVQEDAACCDGDWYCHCSCSTCRCTKQVEFSDAQIWLSWR